MELNKIQMWRTIFNTYWELKSVKIIILNFTIMGISTFKNNKTGCFYWNLVGALVCYSLISPHCAANESERVKSCSAVGVDVGGSQSETKYRCFSRACA